MSDDTARAIVLAITTPYEARIAKLEAELATARELIQRVTVLHGPLGRDARALLGSERGVSE